MPEQQLQFRSNDFDFQRINVNMLKHPVKYSIDDIAQVFKKCPKVAGT